MAFGRRKAFRREQIMDIAISDDVTHPLADDIPTYDAQTLTNGGDLAKIKLDDQLYTLRITRAGKLILTK